MHQRLNVLHCFISKLWTYLYIASLILWKPKLFFSLFMYLKKTLFSLCFAAIKFCLNRNECWRIYQLWFPRFIVEIFVNYWIRQDFTFTSTNVHAVLVNKQMYMYEYFFSVWYIHLKHMFPMLIWNVIAQTHPNTQTWISFQVACVVQWLELMLKDLSPMP
jgi:hypothetical protein